jgi:hypothetical protein
MALTTSDRRYIREAINPPENNSGWVVFIFIAIMFMIFKGC